MFPRRAHFSATAVAALACVLLFACGRPPPPKRLPDVGVVTIATQPAELTTVLPGRTDPYETSDVRPQVSGILLKRLFVEGSVVKQGQPLYQIDPAPYKATYDNAVAVLADTKAKAERDRMLLAANAVAKQDYDDALAAYKQALANTETARINLGYTRITAPITGVISRSAVTEGALLTADQTTALATIQTLDPIYVDITQSASELLALKLAMERGRLETNSTIDAPVTLELEDGTTYPQQGRLQFSEVTVDQATGAVTLRAVFPNPQGLLLPGLFVRAKIIEGIEPKAILAPQQGISRDEKGDAIAYIVDQNGIARLKVLKVSRAIGDKWLVTDGLKVGDRLIVEGLQRVSVNAHVHPVPVDLNNPASGG